MSTDELWSAFYFATRLTSYLDRDGTRGTRLAAEFEVVRSTPHPLLQEQVLLFIDGNP